MQIVTKVITAKATTITAASTIKSAAATKSPKQTTIMTVIFRYKYNNITKMTT